MSKDESFLGVDHHFLFRSLKGGNLKTCLSFFFIIVEDISDQGELTGCLTFLLPAVTCAGTKVPS